MKKKVALILNVLLIIFEIIGFIITYNTNDPLSPAYYTEDSNFICLVSSIMFVLYYLSGKSATKTLHLFRFTATLNLVLTFFITLFILSNDYGLYEMMIHNEFLIFHTLCPIISLISYLFFEKYRSHKNNIMFKAPIFTFVYGLIMFLLNFLKVMDGPYSFFQVYEHSIVSTLVSFVGIAIAVIVITFTLFEIKKKIKI